MPDLVTASAPPAGIWRVGRTANPYERRTFTREELYENSIGERFDVPEMMVLYFADQLVTCFAEVLAPLRPKPSLAALVREEWLAASYMRPNCISAGWRHQHTAVQVRVRAPAPFLDLSKPDTLFALREVSALALGLSALGYEDLDFGLVQGPDQRITRLIAEWAFRASNPDGTYRFEGIRYRSRLNPDWICWAIFPGDYELEQLQALPVDRTMPDFMEIAEKFGLHFF